MSVRVPDFNNKTSRLKIHRSNIVLGKFRMKEKSLKLNFLMNMILTMSSFIFPLITFPYISRILLPIGTGRVSFATSIISYFQCLRSWEFLYMEFVRVQK